jgi:hypothetical protein
MAAIAGDLYFFAPGILAEVAAKFLAWLYVAITGFVGALVLLLVHVLLLTSTSGNPSDKSSDGDPQYCLSFGWGAPVAAPTTNIRRAD